jgi:hypothetical protein
MAKKKPTWKPRPDLVPHRLVIWLPADIYPEQIQRIEIRWEKEE